MFLKKLELKGFKSFADNTEINFNPGINVIVGPNGCGKSNIVDAIRWVLGESNVRNLRGIKSEDVIFNGTDKAKALGMASVEMIIDNSDNVLPVDYSEIMVGRKVFRSGESEFYLNKSRVRMKDIGNLFMGTGLGKRGYSIISQGELEQVLNGQPIDRRLILEEASGVIKYRQQRDEVTKRIADTGNDLLRLADILAELKQQQEDLSHKASKAKKYLALSQELNIIEKKLLSFELSKVLKDYNQKNSNLSLQKEELNQLTQREKEHLDLLNANENSLEMLNKEIMHLKDELHSLETKKNSLEGDIRLCQERVNNNLERIKLAAQDENKYKEMLNNISKEVEARQKDLDIENSAYKSKEAEADAFEKSLNLLRDEISELESKFESEKANIFTHMENESQIKNKLIEKEDVLKRLKEKRERLILKKDDLVSSINNNRLSYTEMNNEIEKLEETLREVGKELEKIQSAKEELTVSLNKVEKNQEKLENDVRVVNNQLLSIKDSEEKLVGYSSAVKKVLESKNKLPGIMGIVGEIIQVPEGLEVAIETAAGRGLENIVVNNSSSAQKVIAYLKNIQGGRVTLLPLDILKISPLPETAVAKIKAEEGVLGIASQLIEFDAAFYKAIEYLLGRVLIVNNMETGIRIFKKYNLPVRIVTVEGEIISTSGAMTGGSNKTSDTYSPLKRKSEERRLIKLKEEITDKINQCWQEKTALKEQIAVIEEQYNQAKDKNTENEFKLSLLLKQKEILTAELDNAAVERQEILQNIENLTNNINDLDKEILELKSDLSNMQKTSTSVSEQLENLRNLIDRKRRDYEVGLERLSSYKEYLMTKEKEITNIKHSIEQFKQVQNSYYRSRQDAINIKVKLEEEINKEQNRITNLMAAIDEHNLQIINVKSAITSKQTAQEEQLNEITELKNILIPLRERIIKLESSIHSHEISVARLETELTALKEKWREAFKCEPSYEDVDFTPQEIRAFKSDANRISEEITSLGSVDIESIKEYEEITERVNFLDAQFQDLTEAKVSLEKLLEETEKIMIKQFTHFFALANESFKKTFSEIFGGGEAFLSLDDNENRLEAGVNIQVKLPGKKTQSLSLLSGGERALTCIAFIFALLRLKPAPFCLLDEIDAALDEINLVRFSDFIKLMAQEMQFIIITHRQTTIECGQNIYGVTMPQVGISSVLTLNLEEAHSLAG